MLSSSEGMCGEALDAEPNDPVCSIQGARAMLDVGEERGWIEPAELEASPLENDLAELDVEELTRELERIGLEVREAVADEKAAAEAAQEHVVWRPISPSRRRRRLRLFLRTSDVTSCHRVAEVTLAKAIERGDLAAKRPHRSSRTCVSFVSIAEGYRGLGVPFLDLIQEGTIGLNRADRSSTGAGN